MTAVRGSRWIAALAVVLIVLAVPNRVQACTCGGPPDAALAIELADVAFTGVVVAVDQPLALDVNGEFATHFLVEEAAKGPISSGDAVVLHHYPGNSCSMGFEPGQRWRIHAYGDPNHLETNICAGNLLLASDAEIPVRPFNPSPLLVIPLVVLIVGGAAFVIGRRGSAEPAGHESGE